MVITDDANTCSFPNYKEFKDHRHDQAILSILIKKYNQANSGKANINNIYIFEFNLNQNQYFTLFNFFIALFFISLIYSF